MPLQGAQAAQIADLEQRVAASGRRLAKILKTEMDLMELVQRLLQRRGEEDDSPDPDDGVDAPREPGAGRRTRVFALGGGGTQGALPAAEHLAHSPARGKLEPAFPSRIEYPPSTAKDARRIDNGSSPELGHTSRAEANPGRTPYVESDGAALLALRVTQKVLQATGKWGSRSASLDSWAFGISVNDLGRVVKIMLVNGCVTGPIPKELGGLSVLRVLILNRNGLTGSIPKELGTLAHLEELDLTYNELEGSIPEELAGLQSLRRLDLNQNRLNGEFPLAICEIKSLARLRVRDGNDIDGAPPDMDNSGVIAMWLHTQQRLRQGDSEVDERRPLVSRITMWMVYVWHFLVPVIDDITDVLLLVETGQAGSYGMLWWVCLCLLLIAEVDRLYVLFLYLIYTLLASAWFILRQLERLGSCLSRRTGQINLGVDAVRSGSRFFNFGQKLDAGGLFLDAALWLVLGSRARSSDLMLSLGLAGQEPAQFEEQRGRGLRAIDILVRGHPFRFLGEIIFSYPYGHHIPGEGGDASRRAEAMTRAVGETLVVDTSFLILSIASEGHEDNLTGIAGVSAIFSVLELVSELQYYVDVSVSSMRERFPEPVEVSEPPRSLLGSGRYSTGLV